jgi:hypothetical protein
MAVYAARKGVVYMSSTGSGAATSVLNLNQWTLNKQTDKIETTSFGDANKTYVQGLPDIQGTLSGFWNDLETKPFAAAASTDGCKLYLYPSSDKTGSYHYGPAWLDASMDVTVSGAVTVSMNFVANGSWGAVAI